MMKNMLAIADIKLKDGVETEFKKWFSEANQILSKLDGFVSRKLLESNDGTHRIIVEHQSMETFQAMHNSEEHSKLHAKAITFMESPPIPKIYNIVAS